MARILYIDDEEALRAVVAEILATAGHDVVLAADGLAGVEAVRRERPDLVLCDVNMPGLDGYGVLQAIHTDPTISSTPFLFLTSLGEKGDVRAGMASGADDYLTKPIRNEELLSAVEARLARRKAGQLETERLVEEMRRSVATLLPHELRTPITTILGGSRLLAQLHHEMSADEIGELAGSIFKAAQRLNRMSENYILYTELELQRLVAPGTPPSGLRGSSGKAEVRQATLETAAEWGRGHDLRMELDDAEVPLAAPYLRKLAAELVDNALKFSEAGTPVAVTLLSSTSGVTLEVADRGRGMALDQVREIGAFRQFDRRLFEQQGSGLGIALVQGLVSVSGGHLRLESRLGQGTRVRIQWPG